jgi:hypothetical protein
MFENVIQALLTIWQLLLQPLVEPLDDLSEEYSRFTSRIEKPGILVGPQGRR